VGAWVRPSIRAWVRRSVRPSVRPRVGAWTRGQVGGWACGPVRSPVHLSVRAWTRGCVGAPVRPSVRAWTRGRVHPSVRPSFNIDCLTSKLIINALLCILPVITHIFNFNLSYGSYPEIWKTAIICPLPKVKHPSYLSDYRPISILCSISKASWTHSRWPNQEVSRSQWSLWPMSGGV